MHLLRMGVSILHFVIIFDERKECYFMRDGGFYVDVFVLRFAYF